LVRVIKVKDKKIKHFPISKKKEIIYIKKKFKKREEIH
jgi:hypothetical protein